MSEKRIRAKLKDNLYEELTKYWTEDMACFSQKEWNDWDHKKDPLWKNIAGKEVVLIEDGEDKNGNMTYFEEADDNWVIPERCIATIITTVASEEIQEIIDDLIDFSKTITVGTSIHEGKFRNIINKLQKMKRG